MLDTIASMLSALNEARSFVDGAKNNEGRNKKSYKALNATLEILHAIYFAPSGTRAILEMLAEGEKPRLDEWRDTLLDFNDYEYWSRSNWKRLEFSKTDFDDMPLGCRELLDDISYGKPLARESVQELLNGALTDGEDISPEAASDVLEEIYQLNAKIQEAEALIVSQIKDLLR
jgi:hypothetical protein